jgi:hypothetical protein
VFAAAFAWLVLTIELVNDHFDRISRGRQILVYGDRPFVDFRDPGYFLTLYTSAAAQAVTGGRLIGEAMVDSAAIAGAVAVTFSLAARVGHSTGIGLVAAIFTLIVAPRYYDYDKVLFYTVGLMLAWWYTDRRATSQLVALAALTAVAGLFRYDNGLFLFVVTAVTLLACHWRAPWLLTRRTMVYVAVVLVVLAPAAVAWQQSIGLAEVARQIRAYAEVEGARTGIFTAPVVRPDGEQRPMAALFDPENRIVLLYYAIVGLLPLAATRLLWRAKRPSRDTIPGETPKIAAVVTLGALVAAFILRDPIVARLGAAAPTAAILGAWLAAPLVPRRGTGHRSRSLVIVLGGAVVLNVALLLTDRSPADLLQVPQTTSAGLNRVRALKQVPPSLSLLPDAPATRGMVEYLRACTPPGSRVLVDGFTPQAYFFAERGFAGGMPVFFGGHWSTVLDQEQTIEQLRREFVRLAIVEPGFASTYDRVDAYLKSAFILAGSTSFGNPRASPGGYQVFLRRGVGLTTHDDRWKLPCLSGLTPAAPGRS